MWRTDAVRHIPHASAALLGFLLWGCTELSPLSGTITQSGNGIVSGKVASPEGSVPAAGARVLLLPSDYNPVEDRPLPDSLCDTTGADGSFRIDAPGRREYTIEVLDPSGRSALVPRVALPAADSVVAVQVALAVPGSLTIEAPASAYPESGYFYLPGTTFYCWVTAGTIVIPAIPSGVIPAVCAGSTERPGETRVVASGITVPPAGVAAIADYYTWKHSRKIFLNTSPAGADVAGDVHGFPVAIRLTGAVFNFAEALRSGADVRLAGAGNAPLACEIESWDSAGQSAALWVTVDTVRGNNDTQFITMYWGNPQAKPAGSAGAQVFGAGSGFAAVWHLNQDCLDATGNGYTGVNYGASDTAGMIGYAKKFGGDDSIRIAGLFGRYQNVTVSAWARLDAPDSVGAEVISLGDNISIRLDDIGVAGGAGTWGEFRFDSTFQDYAAANAQRSLARTGWHLLSFAIDSAAHTQTFCIDGAVAAVLTLNKPVYYHQGRNTYIGRHGFNWFGSMRYNFTGLIDEVRICRVARSADWSRLCFMNQGSIDRLTVFE